MHVFMPWINRVTIAEKDDSKHEIQYHNICENIYVGYQDNASSVNLFLILIVNVASA